MFRTLILADDRATRDLIAGVCRERGHAVAGDIDSPQVIDADGQFDLVIIDRPGPGQLQAAGAAGMSPDRAKYHLLVIFPAEPDADITFASAAGPDDFLVHPLSRSALNLRLALAERHWQLRLEQRDKPIRCAKLRINSIWPPREPVTAFGICASARGIGIAPICPCGIRRK